MSLVPTAEDRAWSRGYEAGQRASEQRVVELTAALSKQAEIATFQQDRAHAAETQMRAKDEALGHVHNWLANSVFNAGDMPEVDDIDGIVLNAINFREAPFALAPVTTPPAETREGQS